MKFLVEMKFRVSKYKFWCIKEPTSSFSGVRQVDRHEFYPQVDLRIRKNLRVYVSRNQEKSS